MLHSVALYIYSTVAICVLVLFIISPTILLILYPTRLFRRCVSCCGFRRWHALHMFVESFQGQYKDGTNGSRDFRMVSASFLILRIVILVSFLNRQSYVWSSSGQCLLLAGVTCFYAIIRPYKLNFMNGIGIVILFLLEVLSFAASNPVPEHFTCTILVQRRRRRSGWSGQGRTTFQQVVGLISRLQRRSANEMVGPGVPRKLAFAQRVGVSRINRSCFASRSCRSLARPDRTASAPTFCYRYTVMRIRRAAASDMAHSAACSSSASQSSPTRRPNAETPHQLLSLPVSEKKN